MRANEIYVQIYYKLIKCINVVFLFYFFKGVVGFSHSENKKDFMMQVP